MAGPDLEKTGDVQNEKASPENSRYIGYDRVMGKIAWLLIAIVSIDIRLMPRDGSNSIVLAVICVMLFTYNIIARYGIHQRFHGRVKTFVDLIVFMCFAISVSWYTGKTGSPFISLLYLGLMATALTQGKRVTYLMSALAITSYTYLAIQEHIDFLSRSRALESLLQIFPFMLIAHLGAMLAGETEHARQEVERLSLTDEITGFHNMRSFAQLAANHEESSKRYKREFSLCMLDADNLKKINDLHGHLAGTELIRHMGEIIGQCVRAADVVARYGGDEFIILFGNTPRDKAIIAVERIVKTFAATPFLFNGKMISSTVSAGLATFPADGSDVRSVMANADEAMYISKASGKNRVTIHGIANS